MEAYSSTLGLLTHWLTCSLVRVMLLYPMWSLSPGPALFYLCGQIYVYREGQLEGEKERSVATWYIHIYIYIHLLFRYSTYIYIFYKCIYLYILSLTLCGRVISKLANHLIQPSSPSPLPPSYPSPRIRTNSDFSRGGGIGR